MKIATDGGSRGNGSENAKAAYAVVAEENGEYKVLRSRTLEEGSTNNKAELVGLYIALFYVKKLGGGDNTIYTDSQYVITTIKNMYDWKRNGWTLKSGKPAKNVDIITMIMGMFEDINDMDKAVDVKWVKGHANGSAEERLQDFADKTLNKTMND